MATWFSGALAQLQKLRSSVSVALKQAEVDEAVLSAPEEVTVSREKVRTSTCVCGRIEVKRKKVVP